MHGTGNVIYRAAALGWLAVVVTALGCQTRGGQAAFSNPFVAPDRVPPPTTRALVPGTAQPYYPGDPVPVLQSAVPTPQQPLVAAPTVAPAPITPIPPVPTTQPTGFASTPSAAASFNNPVQPVAYNGAPGANNFPTQSSPAAPQTAPEVADTGYSQPGLPAAADPRAVLQSQTSADAMSQPVEPAPWRSPQAVDQGQFPIQSPSGAAMTQPVDIRPVPSDLTTGSAATNSALRIRFPGYPQPAVNRVVQPVNYTASIQQGPAAPGVPQTVAITALPPYQPTVAAVPQVAPTVQSGASPWQGVPTTAAATGPSTHDGFRPRSSLR